MNFSRPSSLRLIVLLSLLAGSLLVWLLTTRWGPIREHRLYLFEPRLPVTLPFSELSEDWTEADVLTRFAEHNPACFADQSLGSDAWRRCAIDTASVNGIPAMYVNFWFKDAQLRRVAAVVPWWNHQQGFASLLRDYGMPSVMQPYRISGVRLSAWRLAAGATLFYNRDREWNPLEPSSVQWMSKVSCDGGPCLR